MEFRSGNERWLYTGTHGYALGTSLMYRKAWWQQNPFPDVQIGEDAAFARRAYFARQLVTAPAGDLMWATIHPQNTSPRRLAGKQWKRLG